MGKTASFHTRDFKGKDPSVDVTSIKELRKIAGMTLGDVAIAYEAPPNDDAFFDFRSPPQAWETAFTKHSNPHVFLQALSLAITDTKGTEYRDLRGRLIKIIDNRKLPKQIRDMARMFLYSRPKFAITRLTIHTGVRVAINAWDKWGLRKFREVARDYEISMTKLLVVFSGKSLTTSKRDDPNVDDLKEDLLEEWDRWLDKEIEAFKGAVEALEKMCIL